jgi:hypothetical protein
MRRRGLVSNLYRMARLANDVKGAGHVSYSRRTRSAKPWRSDRTR